MTSGLVSSTNTQKRFGVIHKHPGYSILPVKMLGFGILLPKCRNTQGRLRYPSIGRLVRSVLGHQWKLGMPASELYFCDRSD